MQIAAHLRVPHAVVAVRQLDGLRQLLLRKFLAEEKPDVLRPRGKEPEDRPVALHERAERQLAAHLAEKPLESQLHFLDRFIFAQPADRMRLAQAERPSSREGEKIPPGAVAAQGAIVVAGLVEHDVGGVLRRIEPAVVARHEFETPRAVAPEMHGRHAREIGAPAVEFARLELPLLLAHGVLPAVERAGDVDRHRRKIDPRVVGRIEHKTNLPGGIDEVGRFLGVERGGRALECGETPRVVAGRERRQGVAFPIAAQFHDAG